jgi:hypothetical protein
MAKIEIFFGTVKNINLTASVGENGVNLKDDVMVVQAMLKYALEDRPHFRRFKFPEPTGTINEETKILIREYQRYLRRKDKVSVSVDGVIDRAIGEKAFGKRGFWTILCLNTDILVMRLLRGGEGNEFEDLCRKFPQLYAVLDDIPVGSLGLSLEPSVQRAGSLNLGLE